MFDLIFGNDEHSIDYKQSLRSIGSSTTCNVSHRPTVEMRQPPAPRSECGLCGLENQGSTCYLNSLVQTLLLTPEFREALFNLPENELGDIEDKGSKVRIIPLQLQKLFVRLLLVDRRAISTAELTNSFGWNEEEGLQQHDVQELNRILFSAIESSLVGTSGSNLISQLYHGAISSQVICCQCRNTSQRTEDFLDLPVILSGHESLQESLHTAFEAKEIMLGKNQYFCNHCSKFVDAEKSDKLISLPPILSFSLLRFIYDFDQGKRFKNTGKFSFPMEIDMQLYCDKDMGDDSKYQLFSVIVHSGNCYGGHYHAYIRDIDHLGDWISPIPEEALKDGDEPNYLLMKDPVTLLVSLLMKHPFRGLRLHDLCSEIVKTGMSWNRRFRKNFGPLQKFLMQHSNIFCFNKATDYVYMRNGLKQSKAQINQEANCCVVNQDSDSGDHWFNFNDSRVNAVDVSQMEKQFSGNESAYMLFYRRSTMTRPEIVKGNKAYSIPDKLLQFVQNENASLEEERVKYEASLHMVTVNVHFGKNYKFHSGALQRLPDCVNYILVAIDNRKTLADLRAQIYELSPDLCMGLDFRLHIAGELAAGIHLYDELTQVDTSLSDLKIGDGMHLFVWDGAQVGGESFLTGSQWEPILLRISCTTLFGETFDVAHGFPKSSTLRELKQLLTVITSLNQPMTILLPSSNSRDTLIEDAFVPLENKDNETLESLHLFDCDKLLAKETLPMLDREKQVFVYNKTKDFETVEELLCPMECFTVDKDVTIHTIKSAAREKFSLEKSVSDYRLRMPMENESWRAPIHEHLQAEEILTEKISHLILEEGIPPKEDEITLMLSVGMLSGDRPDYSVNVKKSFTLLQCLKIIVKLCGLEGDSWHLCKSNWMGEPQEVLGKEEMTVESAPLVHGDLLLLQEGRVAPQGFLSLPIWLCKSLDSLKSKITSSDCKSSELTVMYQTLWQDIQEEQATSESAVYIGEVEISSESTLLDLKCLVLTLPKISDIFVPEIGHLRLRLWIGRPGNVLRTGSIRLKKLKIPNRQPLCVQLLPQEEDLTENDLLLEVQQRIPNTRAYLPLGEMVWNTGSSAHIASLRLVLSDATGIPDQHLVMAKYYPSEHSWNVISASLGNKSKLSKKGKTNLRQPPYCLKDGDVIRVKNKLIDVEIEDDFRTDEERELWEKAHCKPKLQGTPSHIEESSRNSPRKPETGLSIRVNDFT